MQDIVKELNRDVKIKNDIGVYQKGHLIAWIYCDGKTLIEIDAFGKNFYSKERSNLFDCLIDIRNVFSELNWLILCNGAREDVYPSGMRRQMNKGLFAYQLTFGKAVAQSDLVDIFQECSEERVVTPEKQKAYFDEWFNS